jgi:hypothetical protein
MSDYTTYKVNPNLSIPRTHTHTHPSLFYKLLNIIPSVQAGLKKGKNNKQVYIITHTNPLAFAPPALLSSSFFSS